MKQVRVKLTLVEEALGSSPSNKQIYTDYIASKAPEDKGDVSEEVESIPEDDKGVTVFPRMEDGTPFIYDYQIKGFFKDTCGALRRATGMKSAKLKAYKKVIDGVVFVPQRRIPYIIPEGGEMGYCERPLRAETPQGQRVALAKSETVPAGSTVEFDIVTLDDDLVPIIKEWLDYGRLRGLGQWRNSGKGRFTWEQIG